jgi:DNA polymerase-4
MHRKLGAKLTAENRQVAASSSMGFKLAPAHLFENAPEFRSVHRQIAPSTPLWKSTEVCKLADLLSALQGVTECASSISHIEAEGAMQLDLPLGLADERRRPGSRGGATRFTADRAVDAIRVRFGKEAVGYGSVALRVATRVVPDAFRELAEREL